MTNSRESFVELLTAIKRIAFHFIILYISHFCHGTQGSNYAPSSRLCLAIARLALPRTVLDVQRSAKDARGNGIDENAKPVPFDAKVRVREASADLLAECCHLLNAHEGSQ